ATPLFDEIAVYRNREWYIDANATGYWEGTPTDWYVSWFGISGDMPIAGSWAPQGSGWLAPRWSSMGVYRPSDGTWWLDKNGNRTWDSGDVAYAFLGSQ